MVYNQDFKEKKNNNFLCHLQVVLLVWLRRQAHDETVSAFGSWRRQREVVVARDAARELLKRHQVAKKDCGLICNDQFAPRSMSAIHPQQTSHVYVPDRAAPRDDRNAFACFVYRNKKP